MRGDIIYNSNTKATMKAATTSSMMNGRRSHQELIKSQSVIAELNPSSEDMGKIWQSLACLLTSRPASGGPIRELRGRRRCWKRGAAKCKPRRSFYFFPQSSVAGHRRVTTRLECSGESRLPRDKAQSTWTKTNRSVSGRRTVLPGTCSSKACTCSLEPATLAHRAWTAIPIMQRTTTFIRSIRLSNSYTPKWTCSFFDTRSFTFIR